MKTAAAIVVSLLLIAGQIVNSSIAVADETEEVCDVRADFALGREDYSETIRLHRAILASHPEDGLAHYHLGFAYGMAGREGDELREYRQAIALGLLKWDLFLNLALAELERGHVSAAIDELRMATRLGPDHEPTHRALAVAYQQAGRLLEALVETSIALRLDPNDSELHRIRALIYADAGDFKRAYDESQLTEASATLSGRAAPYEPETSAPFGLNPSR